MVVELVSLDGGSFAIVTAIESYGIEVDVSWDADLVEGAPVPWCALQRGRGRGFGDAYTIVRYLAGRGGWAPSSDPLAVARETWVARYVVDEIGPSAERLLLVERIAPGMGRTVEPEVRDAARADLLAANPRWLGRSRLDVLEQTCAADWFPDAADNPTALVVAGYAAVLTLAGIDLAAWPALHGRVSSLLAGESFRDQLEHAETILRGDDGIVDA